MTAEVAQRRSRWARLLWWLSPWRLGVLVAFGVGMTAVSAWVVALLSSGPALVVWGPGNAQTGRLVWMMSGDGVGWDRYAVRRGSGSGPPTFPLPAQAVPPGELEIVSPKVNGEAWVGGITTVDEVRTYVYGWPIPSMRWWADFPPATGMARGLVWSPDQPIDRHGGWEIAPGTTTNDAKLLPLSVCVRPFAANVVFWIVTMVASVEVNVAIGRWRRERRERARGLCPQCGYDRTGLAAEAVCPECGQKR